MTFIIKPTSRCNFACSFCSAKFLKIKEYQKVPEIIKEKIRFLNDDWINVTGGEPLMMEPSYFEDLLTVIKPSGRIALTSNLKAFYQNPDKWTPLFKNKRIIVCTSFQYGPGRKWDKNTIYTEEKFIEVMNLFREKVGYTPAFIAVISKDNEDRAIDHLYLAKKLNTTCKLNPVHSFGASTEWYPRYKYLDLLNKIKELELEDYTAEDFKEIENGNCNFNTNLWCESTNRAIWLDENDNLVYGTCEDLLASGLYPLDPTKDRTFRKEEVPVDPNDYINQNCINCELCRMCNGCKINRTCAKKDPDYCKEMLARLEMIKKNKWRL